MLDINTLLKRMKRRIPSPVYNSVDKKFFIDVLNEETLTTYSEYYPKIKKGIIVTKDMGIKSRNGRSKKTKIASYALPLDKNESPYIGISVFYHPFNNSKGSLYSQTPIGSFTNKVLGSLNFPDIRYTPSFISPNIITIDPPPRMHHDFTVNMKQLRELREVKNGYSEWIKKLFEADCKIALYYKFYTISSGSSYGGVEMKDMISEFKDYNSVRESLIEEFEQDFYKDPDMIEEIMHGNTGYHTG